MCDNAKLNQIDKNFKGLRTTINKHLKEHKERDKQLTDNVSALTENVKELTKTVANLQDVGLWQKVAERTADLNQAFLEKKDKELTDKVDKQEIRIRDLEKKQAQTTAIAKLAWAIVGLFGGSIGTYLIKIFRLQS